MKKILLPLILLSVFALIAFQFKPVQHVVNSVVVSKTYIDQNGSTIKERVRVPDGFQRIKYPEGSFQEYIRNYSLKPNGSKVINYDGSPYFYQLGHVGVLDIPVPSNGLQQCADALIRIRSEYLWEKELKSKIGFNFTSGHYCSWIEYAKGYRPQVNGSKVVFSKTAQTDHSKTNFYKYLNLIFTYSGTLSLFAELPQVKTIEDLQIGDMLIIGGSPGHVVMIADVIESKNGKRQFLLIQGNTPAQSVHLLKNLEEPSISP
jgi:hypothetical protein